MSRLFAQVLDFFRPTEAQPTPASALLEEADCMAGFDARHAEELRAAAHAWLRVVR